MLSTYSQLSAELEGRSYGSGALKVEPSEAKRIKLILPRNISGALIEEAFKKIDYLLRRGQTERARKLADRFVLNDVVRKRGSDILTILTNALMQARARRGASKN
jgi:adenine-specific DNA-methyltransferase